VRRDSEYALNAVLFARERLGFEPDERQAAVLDIGIRRGMLNCSRQWGKSTVTVGLPGERARVRGFSNVSLVLPVSSAGLKP
jgi:hypothetical protein